VWKQYGEFFAAVTRDHVRRSHAARQSRRDFDEHAVARRVTEGVVDVLEAIEVEHRDTQLMAQAHGTSDLELDREIELAAVVDTGQAIASGEMQKSLRSTHDGIREHHRGR
jgi:hypothetical protein